MEDATSDCNQNLSLTLQEDESSNTVYSGKSTMVVGCYLAVVVIFGTVGNLIVVHVLYKEVKLHTSTYMVIFNLSVSDLIVSFCATPMSCSSSFMGHWLYGQIGCDYYGFLNYYCGCISLNSYAAIAILRFFIVVKRKVITRQHILRLVCAVHGYTCVFTIPPLFGWNAFVLEGFYTQCDIAYKVKSPLYVSYIYVMIFGLFFVPLIIIACSYYRIIRFVADHETRLNKNRRFSQSSCRSNSATQNSSRTTIIILICSGVFILAWSPYCVVVMWALFGNPQRISQTVSAIPALLAKSSSIFNPWIFAGFNRDFRRALKECILGRFPDRIAQSDDTQRNCEDSNSVFNSNGHGRYLTGTNVAIELSSLKH